MNIIWPYLFAYAVGIFLGWVIWGEEPEHNATDEEIRFHNERRK